MKQLFISIVLLLILKSCILFSDYNYMVRNQRFYYTEDLESTSFDYFKDDLKIVVSAYPPSHSIKENELNTSTINVHLKAINNGSHPIFIQEMKALLKEQGGDAIKGEVCSNFKDLKINAKDTLIINFPIIFEFHKFNFTNHKFILKIPEVLVEEKEVAIPQMIFNYYEGKKPI